MRYIENFELREWVKDNLRKTIFQKAHALAIQTGCEILVKLHDATDTTSHRYYAAGSLHKAYNNHTLRKHPAEKFVSGETGSPLMDQAIQSDDIEHRLLPSDSDNVQQESENNQQFFDENNTDPAQDGYDTTHSEPHYMDNQPLFSNTKDSVQERLPPSQVDSHTSPEEPTLSLHLSVSNEPPDDDADTGESSIEQGISTEETGPTVTDELPEGVQIKVEKMEPEESSYHEHETSMSSETTQHSQPESFDDLQGGMSMDTGMMPTHGEPHTGESDRFTLPISPKPYQCAVCQKAFRSVQVLQKHTQTFHQVRGPSAMMSSHSRGKGHMMVRQNTSKRLQCVMCNRAFPHADLLQDHMARSHMSRDTHQSSQLAASQQQLPPPVFTNTNIAPSTVTSAFGMDNSPGPFNLMESANSSQSQTSTSVPLMQPGSSFPMSTPSLTHQPKRKPGGATYRFPAIGRPSLSTQGKPQSSSPKGKMGRNSAENQRRYREKKKQNDPNWAERESKRVKQYYVPMSERSECQKQSRQQYMRLAMRKTRDKKKKDKEDNPSDTDVTVSHGTNRRTNEADDPEASCSTSMEVKIEKPDKTKKDEEDNPSDTDVTVSHGTNRPTNEADDPEASCSTSVEVKIEKPDKTKKDEEDNP